jgi:FMN phosphatase YigB (HAD superfamily)
MQKVVSFDLWITLIGRNPQFKHEKCELIRNFFRVPYSDDHILEAFQRADRLLDRLQERFLMQPHHLTSWAIVLDEIGLNGTSSDEIEAFLRIYNQLFLEFQPILLDDVGFLFDKLFKIEELKLYLISNTILVPGEILDKFVKTTILKDIEAFYSDSHFPKPDKRAFEMLTSKPMIHVGDNLITDGGCANFGIEFYQVRTNSKSLVDFWEYLEPRL